MTNEQLFDELNEFKTDFHQKCRAKFEKKYSREVYLRFISVLMDDLLENLEYQLEDLGEKVLLDDSTPDTEEEEFHDNSDYEFGE